MEQVRNKFFSERTFDAKFGSIIAGLSEKISSSTMDVPQMWTKLVAAGSGEMVARAKASTLEQVYERFDSWKRAAPFYIDLECQHMLVSKRLVRILLLQRLGNFAAVV